MIEIDNFDDIAIVFNEALRIAFHGDEEDVQEFLELYSLSIYNNSTRSDVPTLEKSREIALHNLGYYAGYHEYHVRVLIEKVFGAVHPIFGSKNPTPEEAFKLGYEYGSKRRHS